MKLGVFLPVSGRAAVPEVLTDAARQAERLGFASVWAAERLVNPWEMTTQYPYKADAQWFVPPESPFLETLTVLTFLAGVTEKVSLGSSVIVLPYRHPLFTARVATSIDTLSKGRLILGVGIGWMPEEFAALRVPFKNRAGMSEEQLRIFDLLWREERPRFRGRYYEFDAVALNPRPVQQPRFPIWMGGESEPAQRRAAKYADAWFSYFVKITADGGPWVRRFRAKARGRAGAFDRPSSHTARSFGSSAISASVRISGAWLSLFQPSTSVR